MTNVYANVTNVLARLSFAKDTKKEIFTPEDFAAAREHAILVSAHFDSALGSPAATDDLVNIAGMLELLRALSVGPRLEHAVVFNFNGAEETINQAAHGFITQHEWVASIRAFINMEGAGAGGKSFMMQTGPRAEWLATAFAAVAPHPTGSTLLEEIFQSGIVPGDTDFRIYRDYGGIPGVDMIELSGDYYYHTKNDDEQHVAPGQIQNMFDNVQALLKVYANDPSLGDRPRGFQGSSVVFYDLLGLCVVVYTHATAAALHVAAALLVILQIYHHRAEIGSLAQVRAAVWTHCLALVAGICAPLGIGLGLVVTGNALRWLPVLPAGPALFGSAALAASSSVYQSRGGPPQALAAVSAGFWACGMLALTSVRCGSAYIFLHLVAWPALGAVLGGGSMWVAVGCGGLASLLPMQYWVLAMDFFIPLMGRSGTEVPAEVIVAIVCSVVMGCASALTAPLLASSKGPGRRGGAASRIPLVFSGVCGVVLIAVLCSSPFTKERPKRFFVQHVQRQFQSGKRDEGLWLNCMDSRCFQDLRTPEMKANLPEIFSPTHRQGQGLIDDMPWYLPISEAINHGIYFPVQQPLKLDPSKNLALQVDPGALSPSGTRKVRFRGSGPTHMTLVINATSAPLVRWPWTPTVPAPRPDCACWFVYFAGPIPGAVWDFELEVRGEDPLGIAFYGHHIEATSRDIQRVLAKLPEWVAPVAWVSQWKEWRG